MKTIETFLLADRALEHHRTAILRRALFQTAVNGFEMTHEEKLLMNHLYKERAKARALYSDQ